MKSSRNKILATISNHKPPQVALPEMEKTAPTEKNLLEDFSRVAISIGASVFPVESYPEIEETLEKEFPGTKRIISKVAALSFPSEEGPADPHSYKNVTLAILRGRVGVAESSAIWVTENEMGERVLPFICQHLALIIKEEDIVRNMHNAYEVLASMEEGFGTFIAGPSKTADIEQSLVLGAHGPRSLTIFILKKQQEYQVRPT